MKTNYADEQRSERGFHTIPNLLEVVGQHNNILDEHSVLIGKNVMIGHSNIFYPGVIIEQQGDAAIQIGDSNTFYPGTYIYGSHGSLTIGSGNEFGPAGLTIRANMPNVSIVIGNDGRYCDSASIMGKTSLGDGSQILGNITAQGCVLAGGGSSKEPNPDKRAAVLKGFGLARGITLSVGQVVNGAGNFSDALVETQRSYHPGAPTE